MNVLSQCIKLKYQVKYASETYQLDNIFNHFNKYLIAHVLNSELIMKYTDDD